jgi:phosphotriesterase-related protein
MDVMTVTGPVPVEKLGVILPHEHLLMAFDWPGLWPDVSHRPDLVWKKVSIENLGELRRNYCAIRDNGLLDSIDEACLEVERFKRVGGGTIMEVSTLGLFGNPAGLKETSERTGVFIIAGTGFYLDQTFPDEVKKMTIEQMYDWMMRDLKDGFPGAGVKAGFIGEVGISPEMTPAEERSLRASARAQRDANVAMNIHVGGAMRKRTIEVLKEEGANFKKISFAHCDGSPAETVRELAAEGIYVESDCFGNEFYVDNGAYDGDWPWYFGDDGRRLGAITAAIDAGLSDHLFFSQDVCSKMQTVNYGGYGYAHLLENILPMLEYRGVPRETLVKIMTENVLRYLCGE